MIRAAALLACLLLAACGQKGNLYLPDESDPVVVPATPPSPAAAPAANASATPANEADTNQTDEQRRQQNAPGNNAAGN